MTGKETQVWRDARLIEDLLVPDPRIYWCDFLASVTLLYLGFLVLAIQRPHWLPSGLLVVVCSFLAYRCAAFLHEIVHRRPRDLVGFAAAYNLLFGFVFKLPVFLYTPHLEHHSPRVFATTADPEYATWGDRPVRDLAIYACLAFAVFPGFLLIRLGVIPILMPFVGVQAKDWIYRRMSTLTSRRHYDRPIRGAAEVQTIRRQELCCALYNSAFIALAVFQFIPWHILGIWYVVTGLAMSINLFRSVVNHGYTLQHAEHTFKAMIIDSFNVTGNSIWALAWSPLDTRYHGLHHLYPSIPYHSLRAAHNRLMERLPGDHPYRQCNKSSYPHAFHDLIWPRNER